MSPVALDQARALCPGASFIEADIVKYRPDVKFDLIFIGYVLIHLVEDEDWNRVLDMIAEGLRNDGMIFLMDRIPDQREHNVAHVVSYGRSFTSPTYLALLQSSLLGPWDRASQLILITPSPVSPALSPPTSIRYCLPAFAGKVSFDC